MQVSSKCDFFALDTVLNDDVKIIELGSRVVLPKARGVANEHGQYSSPNKFHNLEIVQNRDCTLKVIPQTLRSSLTKHKCWLATILTTKIDHIARNQ